MTPGVLNDAAEKNLDKQMGCMAGFFQLFDRHQILNGKRVYSAKRLPSSSPGTTSPSPSERSDASPTSVKEVRPPSPPQPPPQQQQSQRHAPEPTTPVKPSDDGHHTLPLPVFTTSTTVPTAWKLRDGPRLSLDSRIFDGKPTRIFPREIRTATAGTARGHHHPDADVHGRQRTSPSVVARLMGLDNLLTTHNKGFDAPPFNDTAAAAAASGTSASTRAPELRRSASESRASRDLMPPPPHAFQAEINARGAGDEQQRRRQDHLQQHATNILPHTPYFDPITAKFVTDKAVGSQKPPLSPSAANLNTATGGNYNQSSPTPSPFPVPHRKSFFDAHDVFPEPAKLARSGSGVGGIATSSMYGEIEKRLRMRGIDQPAKDLETLKQILEALQLKGLLHQSRRQRTGTAGSNVVDAAASAIFNRPNPPLILIAGGARSSPSPSPRRRDGPPTPPSSRLGAASPRRNAAADPRPRRDRERGPNPVDRRGRGNGLRSPSDLTPADVRSPRSPVTTRRQINSPTESRRNSPAQSPRSLTPVAGLRRPNTEPAGRSPRTRKPHAAAAPESATSKDAARFSDESSPASESSYNTISQFDFENVNIEDYREGRNLLERCDKLLNSIAELTDLGAAASSSRSMEIQQPSPVSVLDASAAFYCDDTTSATGSPPSPSPAASKRCLDFFKDATTEAKQLQREEQCWTPMELHPEDEAEAGDEDFLYVAEVLSASAGPSANVDEDVFYFLEKRRRQQFQGDQCPKEQEGLRLHRRLVFDTVVEIVDKKRQVSTWEAFTRSQHSASALVGGGREVWEEFKQIRECGDHAVLADDFFEAVCGVLKKDMARDLRESRGWGSRSGEISDGVLDIERLIFKDLVAETIRDLAQVVAASSSSSTSSTSSGTSYNNCRTSSAASGPAVPRRKLVF